MWSCTYVLHEYVSVCTEMCTHTFGQTDRQERERERERRDEENLLELESSDEFHGFLALPLMDLLKHAMI